MAQIIEKIVRSEYPPKDKGVIWLDTTDNTLKSLTPNGWTKILDNNKIDALKNAGYLYAGIATLDTNPKTPDVNVFYIANEKGTYKNFGGINVTEDEVIILYYDNAWHKISTGIASQAKLSELMYKVDDLTSTQIDGYWQPNSNDNSKAAYRSNYSNLKTVTLSVSAGDIIETSSVEIPNRFILWPLLKEDDTIVQKLSNFSKLVITNEMVEAGAVKLGICYRPSEQPESKPFFVKRSSKIKFALEDDVRNIEDLTNDAKPGYWNADSTPPRYTIPSDTTLRTVTFDILEGDIIHTNFKEPPTHSVGCFLFNKYGESVQRIKEVFSEFTITKEMIAAGAVKMNVTYRTSNQTEAFYLIRYRSKISIISLENDNLKYNKKVILFGDSQVGNCRMEDNLSKLLGTTVYNFGFGGCRWTWRTNDGSRPWDAFTMLEVARCMTTGNFTMQDAALEDGEISPTNDAYFWDTLAAMKTLYNSGDIKDGADYIITIAYGGNDYSAGCSFGSEDSNSNQEIFGAMNQVFNMLLTKYPALTIYVINPTFVLFDTNIFVGATINTVDMTMTYESRTYTIYEHTRNEQTKYYVSSDDFVRTINGVDYTRRTYGEKILKFAEDKYKIQTFNMYTRGARNIINIWDICPDGVHPYSDLGKYLTADKYMKILKSF